MHPLGLRAERDALLYVPESAGKFEHAPLILSLHGATRNADRGIDLLRSLADEHGFLLLAPASIGHTWDVIESSYGPDIAFINKSLARTFELRDVDPNRIAIVGFSDGASYSLSVGLVNGDFFAAVFGFSPGFIVPGEFKGKPPVSIFTRNSRSYSSDRRMQPEDRSALEANGLPRHVSGIRGEAHITAEVAAEAMRSFMELA